MRPVTVVCVCLALTLTGATVAQAADSPADTGRSQITTGQLSALILQAATGSPEADFDSRSALMTAKRLELVPQSWKDEQVVSSQDLDAVLKRLGAAPSDMLASAAPVTADEAARQIESHAEAIRTLIASGDRLAEPQPESQEPEIDILSHGGRQVRNLSASEF